MATYRPDAPLIVQSDGTILAETVLRGDGGDDTRTRKHCLRAGERHLVVPASSEAAFRRALREVGYLLAPGAPHGANGRLLAPVRS